MSKDNKVLNQHSALTTFQIKKGKYYNAPVEKGIFALLLREQQDLRKGYKNNLNNIFNQISFKEDNKDILMDNLYSLKTHPSLDLKEIGAKEVKSISKEIYSYKLKIIESKTSDHNELDKLKKNKDLKLLEALTLKKDEYTDKEKQLFVTEIKRYCKELTLEKHIGSKTIDFTSLAKSLNTNTTRLKKEMKEAVKTVLEFNYINKKNIDAEVTTNLLSYIEIYYEKENKTNWMDYQIPRVILDMLLLPSVYVPLEEIAISKITGAYTMRMYGLLKDHITKGDVDLEKEEIFNFFMLPKSYSNKTNLEKKFLIPTLEEVERVSGIKTTYEFKPKNKYKSIVFYPKLNKKVKAELLEIIDKKEATPFEDVITDFQKKIDKTKRNIYVSKAWNKRVDNKIQKILVEEGEEFTFYLLDSLYESLNRKIETTLVQYINGILKKLKKKPPIKTNEPKKTKVDKIVDVLEGEILEKKIPEMDLTNFTEEEIKKAIDKAVSETGLEASFFKNIREKSAIIFKNTIKPYLKKEN